MRAMLLSAVCASSLAIAALAAPSIEKSDKESADTPRAPTHDEIRAKQALGRVITSPDGQFFVYEWMRPYNWVPETDWLPEKAGKRMQAWLYKVDTKYTPTTSYYLFHPHPGSSYYLGALSPDSTKVSFYALNHDDNVIKAGVWNLTEEKLTWFEPTPDASRLDEPPVWLSNDELIYPGQPKLAALVKANVATGEAKACAECEPLVASAKAAVKKDDKDKKPPKVPVPKDVGPNAKLLARSDAGDLAVYAKDTAEMLTLLFKKGENPPEILFENKRR